MKRLVTLASLTLIAIAAGCADQPSVEEMTEADLRFGVSAPTFTPAAGALPANSTVSAASTTVGSTTTCTTDGSTPTTASPVCTNVVVVPPVTVKARAFTSRHTSSVASATYTLQSSTAPTQPTTPTTPTQPTTPTTPTTPTQPSASIQLIGNKIYDSGGQQIIARGPEMTIDGASRTADVDAIAASGANAMRMLLVLDSANGTTPQSFDTVLGEAAAKHMLVWVSLYVWNSSANYVIGSQLGGGNFYSLPSPAGAGTCSSATPGPCYLAMWSRQWLKDLTNKYRANVIIDAAQEYIGTADAGTEAGRAEWAAAAEANVAFFRGQGYTNPLEIMANIQGRDLDGIVEYGTTIRLADALKVSGYPQTMFGWQAYWGTTDDWYPKSQGALLAGAGVAVTGPQAIHTYAAQQAFPIEIGIDNYAGDTNLDWQAEIDQCAADGQSWLWWSWQDGSDNVDCPVSGSTCQTYVMHAANGFAGAKPLSQ